MCMCMCMCMCTVQQPPFRANGRAIKYTRCVYHFGFMFTFTVTTMRRFPIRRPFPPLPTVCPIFSRLSLRTLPFSENDGRFARMRVHSRGWRGYLFGQEKSMLQNNSSMIAYRHRSKLINFVKDIYKNLFY